MELKINVSLGAEAAIPPSSHCKKARQSYRQVIVKKRGNLTVKSL